MTWEGMTRVYLHDGRLLAVPAKTYDGAEYDDDHDGEQCGEADPSASDA